MTSPTATREPVVPATDHRRRDVLVLAIPQVILLGGMGLMLALHPNAVRSGVMSTRAVILNAVLLLTWVLLSFVILPRLVRNVFVRATILTAGALVAVALLVLPTLRDKKIVESFPVATADVPAAAAPSPSGGGSSSTVPALAPVRVSTGELVGIDHDATGRASVYRQPDGSLVVALEGIDIEPGPDYRVIVVPTPDATRPGEGTELDALRGNQGTQYYSVPSTAGEVGRGWTVLVWCRAFGVPVAAATQHPA